MNAPDFPARDRISLCMIVKNEASRLARCLESARPWVGEIVVVDTGSTDGTVAIAESFGARVGHFAWCDDFAAARNASLDLATREWALVLDADETLIVADPEEFGRAVQQDVLGGFSFRYHDHLEDGAVVIENCFRLFRRTTPGMRYRGRVHEQIAAVADGLVHTAGLACCAVTHDGHTHAAMAAGKTDRNVRLSRLEVEDRPEDPFAWYCLGLALAPISGSEAVSAFEKALDLASAVGVRPDPAYGLRLCLNLLEAYPRLGQAARARALADQALGWYPGSPDLLFLRAGLLLQAGEARAAAADLERALAPESRAFPVIAIPGSVGHYSQALLAEAYLTLGRHLEAEALLTEAAAAAPASFAAPRKQLGSILLQQGEWLKALPHLQAAHAADPEDAGARFNMGWCLAKLDRYDEAETALRPLADRPDAQHLLGKIHLERGEGERALALLGACGLPAAGLARGWALYLTGRPGEAADCWADWLRAGAADWGTKDTLAMFLFLMQGGGRPSGEPERPAEPLRDMDQWFRLLLRYRRLDEVKSAIARGPQLGERLWRPLRRLWGITLMKEDHMDQGTALLLEAQAASPEDPEIYYWLGMGALHRRLPEDAKVLWETCLRYDPTHALASHGLSLLR